MLLLACLSSFVKDQIASFELKQVVAVLKCSVCVFMTYFVAKNVIVSLLHKEGREICR